MNRLPLEKRVQIIALLVEGNSINATSRLTGVHKSTILKLLVTVGKACAAYQNRVMRGLTCRRVECDEIWAFVSKKEKRIPEEEKALGIGDVYTWVALDTDSRLVFCWHVANRDAYAAHTFIKDLASRVKNRTHLVTDGFSMYLDAVEQGFGCNVDYSMLVKHYSTGGGETHSENKYSQSRFVGAERRAIKGKPDLSEGTTAYVERQNLTMRMSIRRFARRTNAFSKKMENHMHAVSLHFMYYNFCRIHQTLRVTPAMEAGICGYVWEIEEILLMAITDC